MPGNNKHIKLTLTFDNDAWNILSLCPIGSEAKELIKDQNLSPEFAYDLFRDPLTFGFEYEFIFMKPDSPPIFTIEENGQIIDQFRLQNFGADPRNFEKEDKKEEKDFQKYLNLPKQPESYWFNEDVIKKGMIDKKDKKHQPSLIRMFRNTLRHFGYKKALLVYVKNATEGEISFEIEIPHNREFDADKIKFFFWHGRRFKKLSPYCQKLLKKDLILLNAIRYEGELYFSDEHYWDDEDSFSFEFVNKYLKSTSI